MKRCFSSVPSTRGMGTLSYIYRRLPSVRMHRKMPDSKFVTKLNPIAFWAIPCTASSLTLFSAGA